MMTQRKQTLLNRAGLSLIGLAAGLTWLGISGAAEIIFDNTLLNAENMFFASRMEFGDELNLGGTARTITEVQIEYFGEFNPTGAESARVRLYANDGAGRSELGQFAEPGSLLYESEPMIVGPGFNILALRHLSVTVSNNFTWVVKFEGLSGSYSNRTGLVFYDPPTIGFSYDDFWQKTPTGWLPFNFNGNPKSNFAIRIAATPDTPAKVTMIGQMTNGEAHLKIQGPTYHGVVLETSTDLTHWTPLRYFVFLGNPIDFVTSPSSDSTRRFYRARLPDEPTLLLASAPPAANGEFRMRLFGPPGHSYVVETSRDTINWLPNQTNYFTTVQSEFVDTKAGAFGRRFYRATLAPDQPVLMVSVSRLANGKSLLLLAGPNGRDCVVEASADLSDWKPLSTNTFSFTGTASGGTVYWVDPETTNAPQRFYRAQLLP